MVSVEMLNEGWDAQNVTQILGLRAFTSQLLCEQVIGRGLRRLNYNFEVIPVKKKPMNRSDIQKVSTLVRALPERKHLEIIFPRVEGYVFDVRSRIRVDLSRVPDLEVTPTKAPTEVTVKPAAGQRIGRPDRLGPGPEFIHDRSPFYREKRIQAIVFEIEDEITNRIKDKREEWSARHTLFPQVLCVVRKYLDEKVKLKLLHGTALEEVALLKYRQQIVERLLEAVEPDTSAGEPPLLPIIERFRPTGSTAEVLFRTFRPCVGTTKSHINHVVLDAHTWEHSVAYQLERIPEVIAYAKNDHLDFTIP